MKEVFIIIDNKGKAWKETVYTDERQCKILFAKNWLPPLEKVADVQALGVWSIFEANGWKCKRFEIIQENEN